MSLKKRGQVDEVLWLGDDGEPLAVAEDRFTTRYSYIDEETGEHRLSEWTVGNEGVESMDLRRVVALGFSTDEYFAMVRYEEKTGSPVKSEAELNSLFRPDRRADPAKRQARGTIADVIYVLSWVDDVGNPVQQTADRFHSRFVWIDERSGTTRISEDCFGSLGMSGMSLRDAVNLGFSSREYRAMIDYERTYLELIQSEEELESLLLLTQSTKP
jgi:hypothetical protein